MSQSLSVSVNGKNVVAKGTPSTTLAQIVNDVCTKAKLEGGSEKYGLFIKGKALDLSNPLRYAMIPTGSKLELKRLNTSGNSKAKPILVALEAQDGTRLQAEFATSTSLWEILCHWEAARDLNLTKRKTDKPKPNMWVVPCIRVMNKQTSTIEELFSTTLRSLGVSGNVLIHFSYQVSNLTMEEASEAMERGCLLLQERQDAEVQAAQQCGGSAGATQVHDLTPNQTAAASTVQTSSSRDGYVPSAVNSTANQGYVARPGDGYVPAGYTPSASAPPPPMETPPAAVYTSDTAALVAANYESTRRGDSKTQAEKKFEEEAKVKYTVPRDTRMYRSMEVATALITALTNADPMTMDDFASPADAALLMPKDDPNSAILKTKLMKEKEKLDEAKRMEKAVLRIQAPDGVVLEARFHPLEYVSDVTNLVKQSLNNPDIPFYLYVTPPRQVLNQPGIRLHDAHLTPNANIHLGFKGSAQSPYFAAELMEMIEEMPNIPASALNPAPVVGGGNVLGSSSSQESRPVSRLVQQPAPAPSQPAQSSGDPIKDKILNSKLFKFATGKK